GYTDIVRILIPGASNSPSPVVGAGLTYKTKSHAFLTSIDRTASDGYGVGASSTTNVNTSWHWRRPGSSWWLNAGLSWQRLEGAGVGNASGWFVSAGLNRAIGMRTILATQYVYSNYSGGLPLAIVHSTQNAVRLTATWTPFPAQPR